MNIRPILLVVCLATNCAWAQSLKPEDPAPLKAGTNKGIIDNAMQYWFFIGGPGDARITAMLDSGGPLTINVYDDEKSWRTSRVLTTVAGQTTLNGTLKTKHRIFVSVTPPGGVCLVNCTGTHYQLEVSGAVEFGDAESTRDPIVRTFLGEEFGATKFLADGTVETASGAHGHWKLFDPDSRMYVVVIDGVSHSLQYVAGRGLEDPRYGNVIFKELR